MFIPTRRALPAIVAGLLGMGGAAAFAVEPTQQDLSEQVKELKAQVERLSAKQTGPSAAEVDATVSSVLGDAQRRSDLQMTGFMGGHTGGRFLIQDEAGNFSLSPTAQFQFRHVTNYRENGDAGEDEIESGYEVRRMKFGLVGHMFSPKLKYDFIWATDRAGGGLTLEDAFITYQFADQLSFRVGQFKDPVHHEELVSSKRQLAADRSAVNELLGGGATDRVQGVALMYDDDNAIRAQVVYHDGANTDNTSFRDGGTDFGVSGRFEYKAMGDWKSYDDFTAMNNSDDLLVLGAGADFTESGPVDVLFYTLDAQYEVGALALYGAWYGLYVQSVDDEESCDWGALFQAGYMLNEQWELFGRYDFTSIEDAFTGEDIDVCEMTVGVNYYLQGHAAKVTIDATWIPSEVPFGDGLDGIGVLGTDADCELIVRGQFQLLL